MMALPRSDQVDYYVPTEVMRSCSQSCVSSITRDITDYDSNLYPSANLVEGLPDVLVSESEHGKFQIVSQHSSNANTIQQESQSRTTALDRDSKTWKAQMNITQNARRPQRRVFRSYSTISATSHHSSSPSSPRENPNNGTARRPSDQPNKIPIRKTSSHSASASSSISTPSKYSVGYLDRERDEWSMSSSIYRELYHIREKPQLYQIQQEQTSGTPPRWSSFSTHKTDHPLRPPMRDDLSYVDVNDESNTNNVTAVGIHSNGHVQRPSSFSWSDDAPPSLPIRRITQDSLVQANNAPPSLPIRRITQDSLVQANNTNSADASVHSKGETSIASTITFAIDDSEHPPPSNNVEDTRATGNNGTDSNDNNASKQPLKQKKRRKSKRAPARRYHSWCGDEDKEQRAYQLEIQPGLYARLRGTDETLEAAQRGFVSVCPCMSCSVALVCIADAEFVLCQDCKVVSPILQSEVNVNTRAGGVGLGFKPEDINNRLSKNR